jgi:hypothetical protein
VIASRVSAEVALSRRSKQITLESAREDWDEQGIEEVLTCCTLSLPSEALHGKKGYETLFGMVDILHEERSTSGRSKKLDVFH